MTTKNDGGDPRKNEEAGAPAPPVSRSTLPSGGWTVLPGATDDEILLTDMELDPVPSLEEADALLGGTVDGFAEEDAMDLDELGASSLDVGPPVPRRGRPEETSDPHARASFGVQPAGGLTAHPPVVEPVEPDSIGDLELEELDASALADPPSGTPAATQDRSESSVPLGNGAVLRPARRYPIPNIGAPPGERDARPSATVVRSTSSPLRSSAPPGAETPRAGERPPLTTKDAPRPAQRNPAAAASPAAAPEASAEAAASPRVDDDPNEITFDPTATFLGVAPGRGDNLREIVARSSGGSMLDSGTWEVPDESETAGIEGATALRSEVDAGAVAPEGSAPVSAEPLTGASDGDTARAPDLAETAPPPATKEAAGGAPPSADGPADVFVRRAAAPEAGVRESAAPAAKPEGAHVPSADPAGADGADESVTGNGEIAEWPSEDTARDEDAGAATAVREEDAQPPREETSRAEAPTVSPPAVDEASSRHTTPASVDSAHRTTTPPVAPVESDAPAMEAPTLGWTVAEPEGGVPEGRNTWFGRPEVFRSYTQGLARMQRWSQVAQVTAWAATHAEWATGSLRASMLLDLARLYRDRLDDPSRAEEAFEAVLIADPGNAEASGWLLEAARARGDWRRVVARLLAAAEATWDAQQRLDWTAEAAAVAQVQLDDESLVADCWERLWRSGDSGHVAVRELGRAFRRSRRWDDLAAMLRRRMNDAPASVADALRLELVPVLADGTGDHRAALTALDELETRMAPSPGLVAERIALLIQLRDHRALEELSQRLREPSSVREVADALWRDGQRASAARVYARLRDEGHVDAEMDERLDQWFAASNAPRARVDLLLERAERATSVVARTRRLRLATRLCADELHDGARALALLARVAEVEGESLTNWSERARLARATNVPDQEAEALRGMLRHGPGRAEQIEARVRLASLLAEDPETRAEAAHHVDVALGLDTTHEAAWRLRERLDPAEGVGTDVRLARRSARLHAAPAGDPNTGERIAACAELATAELGDAAARNAWIVASLERDPRDPERVRALVAAREASGDARSHAFWAVWAQSARGASTPAGTWKELASFRAAQEDPALGLALQERALAAAARDGAATFDATRAVAEAYRASGDLAAARALVEVEIARATEASARIAWLRVLTDWVDEHDVVRHEETLRRRDLLGDEGALDALYALAERTGVWDTVLERLHAHLLHAEGEAARRETFATIASVLLRTDSGREQAWSVLMASLLAPEQGPSVVEMLEGLVEATGRFEDLAAVHEAAAVRAPDAHRRRDHLLARARLLRRHLDAPERAFAELRRLVEVDPSDEEAFAELEALAEAPALRARFRWVLRGMADRATSPGAWERWTTRQLEAARAAEDTEGARELTLQLLRRSESLQSAVRDVVGDDAAGLASALPWIEAASLATIEAPAARAERLRWVAELWERIAPGGPRAMELRAWSLLARDGQGGFDVDEVAAFTKRVRDTDWRRDGEVVLRVAAGLARDNETRVGLLEAALGLTTDKETLRRVAIHRYLFDTRPDHAEALRALTAWSESLPWPAVAYGYLEAQAAACTSGVERARVLERMAARALENFGDEALALDLRLERSALERSDENEHALRRLGETARSVEVRRRVLERRLEHAEGEERVPLARELAGLLDRLDLTVEARANWAIVAEHEGVLGPAAERVAELAEALGEGSARVELDARRYLASTHEASDALDAGVRLLRRLRAIDAGASETARRVLLHLADQRDARDLALRALVERDVLAREERWDAWIATFHELPDATWERRLKARVLWHCLDRRDDATALWRGLADGDAAGSALFVAHGAACDARWEDWLALRLQAARALPDALAAVALCFVAEAAADLADWHGVSTRMDTAELYREARRLDPTFVPAQEALRAIGRRLRSLRPAASLLPIEGESAMSWTERARVLEANARAAADPHERLDWARRAATVGADLPELWELLGSAASAVGRSDEAAIARRLGWDARERTVRPRADVLAQESSMLLALAASLRASGEAGEAEAVVAEATAICTGSSAALLTWLLAGGAQPSEHELAVRVELVLAATPRTSDTDPEDIIRCARLLALRAERSGSEERAREDLEEALAWDRCNPRACSALADAPSRSGEQLRWLVHALAFESDGEHRARLYRRLAGVVPPAQRGAAYELAWCEGADDAETLRAVLRQFQETERGSQALGIVDSLIENEVQGDELARLWAVRGSIHAAAEGGEERAVEAFDMALSYDPSSTDARLGLAGIFERRGDWEQLLPLLEVMVETTPAAERPAVLRRIGRIALGIPGEEARGEDALREAIALEPDPASLALLEERARRRDPASDERIELLGQRVAFGPPWFEHVLEVGRHRLAEHPRLAWALLSPVLMTRGVDEELKATLREMRRDYERPPVLSSSRDDRPVDVGGDDQARVRARLGALVDALALAPDGLEAAGVVDAHEVSRLSSVGRQFSALAELRGVPDVKLLRGTLHGCAARVVRGDGETWVVLRSDLVQQMARAEVGFLLAAGVELATEPHGAFSALGPDGVFSLVRAVWAALGWAESEGAAVAATLVERVRSALDDAARDELAATLPRLGDDAVAVARLLVDGTRRAAWRAGLVAGADLYQAMRLFARIEGETDRPSLFASLEQIDEVIGLSEDVRDLFVWACTSEFSQRLRDGVEAGT